MASLHKFWGFSEFFYELHVKVLTANVVTVLAVHILKLKLHTIDDFWSVAEAYTLVIPKMRWNAYSAVFKL